MLRKSILAAGAALVVISTAAYASVTFDTTTGAGFVGKGCIGSIGFVDIGHVGFVIGGHGTNSTFDILI